LNTIWKWIISTTLFVLIVNASGLWFLHGNTASSRQGQKIVMNVDPVSITLVNNGEYDHELVSEIEEQIQQSTSNILSVTEGILSPKQNITIVLSASDEQSLVYPSYATSTLFDPDEMWLEDWKFEEMMLYSLFPKRVMTSPFTTIGLGYHLYYTPQKGTIYDAHDMWMVHKKHHNDVEVKGLVVNQTFLERAFEEEDIPLSEAHYWAIASFSSYLIETYGIDSFVQLYFSPNLSEEVEKVYGKSFDVLETEWAYMIQERSEQLPLMYKTQLQDHYDYLYE
jgi:hypothetical protein